MAVEDVRPWDRQEDESPEAYRAFVLYLKLGPTRTIRRLQNRLKKRASQQAAPDRNGNSVSQNEQAVSDSGGSGKAAGWLHRWSSRYGWQERARAYDDYTLVRRKEEEARLIEQDVALAFIRRRMSRNRNWNLSTMFVAKIQEMMAKGGTPVLDADGKPVKDKDGNLMIEPWAPKDLRELGILADRLGMVEERAFKGLPEEGMDAAMTKVGEGLARAFDQFRRNQHLADEGIDPGLIEGL